MSASHDMEIMELLGDHASLSNPPVPADRIAGPAVGTGRESMIAGDAYEGASQLSRELALWNPILRSADTDILPAKNRVDARARDTLRNDAYVMGAANLHRDNIVGSMFMLMPQPSSLMLFGKEDTTWEDEFSEEVAEKFTAWAESPENWVDAQRRTTLTGLIRLLVGIYVARGEIGFSAEWRRDDAGRRPFNTAIQVIDLDRLSTPFDKAGDRSIRAGVHMDKFGAPLGYYIRNAHPTEWLTPDSYTWKYVPARKPWGRMQFAHIFEATREDQTRGIAQMVSALKEMRMTKNFRDVVLQNAVINATYAASIESELPTAEIFARLGGSDATPQAVEAALKAYMVGHYETLNQFMGGAKNLSVNNVKIPHLPPGSKLQLRGAGQGGPLGQEFEQSLLRHIAASLDVSYEELSRDFTQTNYSGFKGALNATSKAMRSRKKAVADRSGNIVYRLWFEEAFNNGMILSLPRRAPSFYEGLNAEAYCRADWIGASAGQIDELKETQAAVLRINNGLSSISEEAARLGIDWRKLMRQLAREKEWKEFYDILQGATDTTDMMNATTGTPREPKEGEADGE
jgi:lambda family phage portal protein